MHVAQSLDAKIFSQLQLCPYLLHATPRQYVTACSGAASPLLSFSRTTSAPVAEGQTHLHQGRRCLKPCKPIVQVLSVDSMRTCCPKLYQRTKHVFLREKASSSNQLLMTDGLGQQHHHALWLHDLPATRFQCLRMMTSERRIHSTLPRQQPELMLTFASG